MNQIMLLFLILILAVGLLFFYKMFNFKEEYSNYTLDGAMGNYPDAQNDILVQDTYPAIGKNELSNNTANDIWKEYPIFELGSYKQITNNIRYPYNPDTGRCMPANFCGALYKDKHLKSNYIEQLPPVDPTSGTRIGYFTTDVNMLPFRTDVPNILY